MILNKGYYITVTLAIMISFCLTLRGYCAEYHVDCSVETSGNGSVSSPFRTIGEAARIMKARRCLPDLRRQLQ